MPLDLLVCSTFGGLTVLSVRESSKPQLRQGNRTVVLSQSLGYLWFYFNKEGPIDRSPAESLYHILNLDFSPRLSYGVSVHSSDNKLNFNVLTFIINAKLSLTHCFGLYCSNFWTNMTSFYNLFQSMKRYFQDVVGYKVPSGSRMHWMPWRAKRRVFGCFYIAVIVYFTVICDWF